VVYKDDGELVIVILIDSCSDSYETVMFARNCMPKYPKYRDLINNVPLIHLLMEVVYFYCPYEEKAREALYQIRESEYFGTMEIRYILEWK